MLQYMISVMSACQRTCELGVDLGADANDTTRHGKLQGILLRQKRHDA